MKRSDKSSYNLKMRTATRREPRVEETVVYHWGRILGALVSLLLIAFVVYWFFTASPGSSVGGSNDPTAPAAEEPEVGTSVSGTIQRSATEPAAETGTATTESPEAGQPDEDSSPFAATEPEPSDVSADTASNEQADDAQTGTDQGNINQAGTTESDPVPSIQPEESEASSTTPEADTGSVALTAPEAAAETASSPPGSVIDDPADQPAPTDDPESAVATSDASSGSVEDGMAQLDIASGHLQRVQLTWELRDREPTTALPAVINLGSREVIRVYFFNELQGLKGQTVYHDWYLNGERVARVDIDAFLDQMRASSGKYINRDMLGDWRVEAVTDSGTVLGSGVFSVNQ